MTRRLISADDHMDLCYLPPDLWQSRVRSVLREQAPRVVQGPNGPIWVREGSFWGGWGSKRADGKKCVFDLVGLPEESEPGIFRPSSPRYRLQDMDADGFEAHVMYNRRSRRILGLRWRRTRTMDSPARFGVSGR